MQVTLYTTKNCMQCQMTAKQFDKRGITYDKINLESHPELADQFRSVGHMTAPIVVTNWETWSGFRMNKIIQLEHEIFGEKKNETEQ